MLNEFDAFAHDVIIKRAEIAHAAMCSNAANCGNWHIRNDYIPRIRREVMAEMESALKNLSRRA